MCATAPAVGRGANAPSTSLNAPLACRAGRAGHRRHRARARATHPRRQTGREVGARGGAGATPWSAPRASPRAAPPVVWLTLSWGIDLIATRIRRRDGSPAGRLCAHCDQSPAARRTLRRFAAGYPLGQIVGCPRVGTRLRRPDVHPMRRAVATATPGARRNGYMAVCVSRSKSEPNLPLKRIRMATHTHSMTFALLATVASGPRRRASSSDAADQLRCVGAFAPRRDATARRAAQCSGSTGYCWRRRPWPRARGHAGTARSAGQPPCGARGDGVRPAAPHDGLAGQDMGAVTNYSRTPARTSRA